MAVQQLISVPARWVAAKAGYRITRAAGYDTELYGAICYLRRWSPGDLVFDVGANDGRTVHRLMRHLPSPRIVAFEPVGATFEELRRQTAKYPDVECTRLAMGNECGQRRIFIHESAAVNSLREDWGSAQGSEVIDIMTLDAFLSQRPFGQIHLLKIDTEGHDLEVLRGAERTLRDGQVEIIMVEAGFGAPGRPQPALEEFQTYLRPLGYHLHGIYNQCHAPLSRRVGESEARAGGPEILIYCDALFVRGRR